MEAPSSNGEPTAEEPSIGRLHVLTDFHLQQDHPHADLARLAIRGGADTIQFRQKHGGVQNQLVEARRVAAVCRDASTPLIVDDRLDIAQAIGADGVHLGQKDFPVDAGRSVLGTEFLIGATATKPGQAAEAYELGADYIGFGPVFPTTSKRNPKSVKGPDGLAQACEAVPIPVIAIGGITHDRVRAALEAGHIRARALWKRGDGKSRRRALKLWKTISEASTRNAVKQRQTIIRALRLRASLDKSRPPSGQPRLKEAINLLKQLAEKDAPNTATPEAKILLARLQAEAGQLHQWEAQFGRARRAYREYIRRYPDGMYGEAIRKRLLPQVRQGRTGLEEVAGGRR